MRFHFLAAVALTACAQGAAPAISTNRGAGDAGDPAPGPSSNPDPDAGAVVTEDAGTPGSSVGLPPVTNGKVTVQGSGEACGSWLPTSVPDAVTVPNPPWSSWMGLTTDGAGDLLGTYVDERPNWPAPRNLEIFPADGGTPATLTADVDPIPTPDGFLWTDTYRGPCMVCDTHLISWPSMASPFVGDGYPWHGYCSWIARPTGGADLVCARQDFMGYGAVPPSLAQFDDALQRMSIVENLASAPALVAVDRMDRIVVKGAAGQLWIDANATPLSSEFEADAAGATPLIGGGLLTRDDRVIPSGSDVVEPAPSWLAGRDGRTDIVLGGRAYAFAGYPCTSEIVDSAGRGCGTVTVSGCIAPPRFGLDGTLIAQTPDGWLRWPRLLR